VLSNCYCGGAALNGVANALTRANGMQMATLGGLGGAPHYIFICASAAEAGASGCGATSNYLTRKAAFVLLSLGPNAPAIPAPGTDEALNLAGNPAFVHREPVGNGDFDDLLQWAAVHIVLSRLVAAGRLP
jgi:hypothetical protein